MELTFDFRVLLVYLRSLIDKFNVGVASLLADTLSSIACFYVITGMILIALIWQTPKDLLGWIQYIVAFLFQGSALPVLGYVSKREGEDNRRLLQETHDMVTKQLANITSILTDIKEMQSKLDEIDKEIEDIDKDVAELDKEVDDIKDEQK
jgi:peptidoglycan hydrolase CwlO-like protein